MSDVWIGVLGALVGAVVGAVVSLVTAWSTARHDDQRARDDDIRTRREEWFRRVQWAESLANDSDEQRWSAGLRILADLTNSDLATPSDVSIVQALFGSRADQLTETRMRDSLAGRGAPVDNGD